MRVEYWLNQLLINIMFLLINPLTYWFLLLLFISSYRRRKQERRFFGTKVTPYFSEWKGSLVVTLIVAIILSVISITFPIELTADILVGIVILFILFSINGSFAFLSGVYPIGLIFLFFLIVPSLLLNVYGIHLLSVVKIEHLMGLAIILTVLILAEALLLFFSRNDLSFPRLMKSNRGKWIGIHQIKKMAIIPFLIYIPVEWVDSIIAYLPFISSPNSNVQLIIFPLFVGYQMNMKSLLPNKLRMNLATQLIVLSILLIVFINISFYYAIFTVVVVVIAILGREYITFSNRMKDHRNKITYGPENDGVKVLGILPRSPAERIGVKIGETIVKVNGVDIESYSEFYEALQNSGAFFKLYIRDVRGEMRFITSAFYEGDHYELGIVFPNEPYENRKI